MGTQVISNEEVDTNYLFPDLDEEIDTNYLFPDFNEADIPVWDHLVFTDCVFIPDENILIVAETKEIIFNRCTLRSGYSYRDIMETGVHYVATFDHSDDFLRNFITDVLPTNSPYLTGIKIITTDPSITDLITSYHDTLIGYNIVVSISDPISRSEGTIAVEPAFLRRYFPAVIDYTSLPSTFNQLIRTDQASFLTSSYLNYLTTAMIYYHHYHPRSKAIIAYRGINVPHAEQYLANLNGKWTESSITSVTPSLQIARSFSRSGSNNAIVFELTIPPELPALFYYRYSFHPTEDEIILHPGTQWKIDNITIEGSSYRYHYVKLSLLDYQPSLSESVYPQIDEQALHYICINNKGNLARLFDYLTTDWKQVPVRYPVTATHQQLVDLITDIINGKYDHLTISEMDQLRINLFCGQGGYSYLDCFHYIYRNAEQWLLVELNRLFRFFNTRYMEEIAHMFYAFPPREFNIVYLFGNHVVITSSNYPTYHDNPRTGRSLVRIETVIVDDLDLTTSDGLEITMVKCEVNLSRLVISGGVHRLVFERCDLMGTLNNPYNIPVVYHYCINME